MKGIGEKCNILESVVISHPDKVKLGKRVSIHQFCYLDAIGEIEIGNNVAIISNTLNTTNGRGKLAVSSSPATTLSLPLKIIDVVEDTKTGSDAFQEVLVVFNAPYEDSNIAKGGHAYRTATGL